MLKVVERRECLSCIVPIKSNSVLIERYGLDCPVEKLQGYNDGTVLYKKVRTAFEQETGYVERTARRKGGMDPNSYLSKRNRFGLIVFQSKDDLPPLIVYLAYLGRWDIEVFFGMYKNIIDRDTVNVHGDYRLYATELINFISTVITTRVRKMLQQTLIGNKKKSPVSEIYSYKQVFLYLSKYKKVRTTDEGKWHPSKRLKYIEELCSALNV